ncbi:Alpha/Beta hydrolase protein [Multifurca ochricompacta]|uniref:Alpha/Beta hydrolase protein n=1 Tax=Multifurca ochricompacta TaxID=376703 RepID=A0AAD4M739_9AGAM|nr:Alpha/Beta hydrolase protein [Multifurca ochricompacta]
MRYLGLLLLSIGLLPIIAIDSVLATSVRHTINSRFDPFAFQKNVVTCPSINRAENKTVDLQLYYVDINPKAKETLLFLHGWPSLWASWKYQIQEFKNDYRLIIPDIRGFGASTHPGDVQSSGPFPDLVGDVIHDWGTQLAYEAARERPDVVTAVVGITIPYMPAAGPFVPISALVPEFPRLTYQLCNSELDTDIRRTLRATLRTVASPPPPDFLLSNSSYLVGWENVTTVSLTVVLSSAQIPPIPFLSRREEDYWNRVESYTFANSQGNETVPQPVLSILPTQDPVGDWVLAAKVLQSATYLPNFMQAVVIQTLPGAHWVQLEVPDEVNTLIRDFLLTLRSSEGGT